MTSEYPVLDRRSVGARLLDRLDRDPSGMLARSLSPLGAVYAAAARRWGEEALPGQPPCVGVGNLRVGGTGKTPVVGQLVEKLTEHGLRVGVLSRGYRAEGGGDEPAWLQGLGARVEVDPDRRRGRERLIREGVDVLLMDDALQTRWRPNHCLGLGLFRDRGRPPRCLPAGPAREGAGAALRRAELWAWRHDGGFPEGEAPASELHFRLEPVELVELDRGTERKLSVIDGRPVVALSGLARPLSFEQDLVATGVDLRGALRFEDHWNPRPGDVEEIRSVARRQGVELMLCPEKNAARLARLDLGVEVLAVRSTVRWWGDEAFVRMAPWFGL